jgi:hypothetical protein
MEISDYTKFEIETDIDRVEAILNSGIFAKPESMRHPLFDSAVTELVIRVSDLLAKATFYANRVAFTDDMVIKGVVMDVTALIKFARDAVCHVRDSWKTDNDALKSRVFFNTIFGKGRVVEINEASIESAYEDDVAFFFGQQRLYLHRHIIRAYNEAIAELRPLLDRPHHA